MPGIAAPRKSRWNLITTLLLLLGAAVAVLVLLQLWRALHLEQAARAVEFDKAKLVAARILKQAVGALPVLELLPAAQRFVGGPDGVAVDDEVGWLVERPAADDADLVVQDRLDRAARAEFVATDPAVASREFDELLAGPLLPVQRLRVLAAAAWQARRADNSERRGKFAADLEQRVGELAPVEFGREVVALAAASLLRLRAAGSEARPAWALSVVPKLPPGIAAAVLAAPRAELGPDELSSRHRQVVERRRQLVAAANRWASTPSIDPFVRGSHQREHAGIEEQGLVPGSGVELLWYIPRDASHWDGALVPVEAWLAVVREAGRRGLLPEWPWLLQPRVYWGTVQDRMIDRGGEGPDDVPWFVALAPVEPPGLLQLSALLPIATAVLLAALAFALWQRFRAARREAAAVRTQAEFLTTVTHELKTPLAAIRLLGEMLVEGRARGREDEYYRMLAGEAGRLSLLIENVLDLGRLERGERSYDMRPLDLAEVVAETLALFTPLAARDGLAVQAPARGVPLPLHGDRGALGQALLSVLDNARKYALTGQRLVVTAERQGGELRLVLRDFGPGVPAADRERIFERFARGRDHAHGSVPGIGVGLYLARTIARAHGGDLRCAVPPDGGAGAEFTFVYPVAEVA